MKLYSTRRSDQIATSCHLLVFYLPPCLSTVQIISHAAEISFHFFHWLGSLLALQVRLDHMLRRMRVLEEAAAAVAPIRILDDVPLFLVGISS